MDIVRLLNFMDSLRYERSLNQEKYLNEVVSQRQYYRYLYRESEPPFEIILKLSKKLNLSIDRLIDKFQEDTQKENKQVQEYFNYVINKKNDEAQTLFSILSSKPIICDENSKFMISGKALFDFYTNTLSKRELILKLKKIIEFDKLIKHDFLQDVELYMLGIIMEYSDNDRDLILNRIMFLNEEKKLFTFGNRLYNSQLYFWIIKNLGRLKRLNDVIKLSSEAIVYCHKEYTFYLLEYFYYYKALAYYKLNDTINFESELFKTIEILRLLEIEKRKKFEDVIFKDTGKNIRDYYLEKLKQQS